MTIRVTGINSTIQEIDQEFTQEQSDGIRAISLQAQADLVVQTPVDSGRARSSWTIDTAPKGNGQPSASTIGANFDITRDDLYINNNTPYIETLNDGHSRQSPSMFIQGVLLRHFEDVGGLEYRD